MASMTMPASFLGSSTAAISKTNTSSHRQVAVVAKATSNVNKSVSFKTENKEEGGSSGGRRELVFAAAAAAMWSAARVAVAIEPKKGTPEAKKKYAPVCVTMPTARICHK